MKISYEKIVFMAKQEKYMLLEVCAKAYVLACSTLRANLAENYFSFLLRET